MPASKPSHLANTLAYNYVGPLFAGTPQCATYSLIAFTVRLLFQTNAFLFFLPSIVIRYFFLSLTVYLSSFPVFTLSYLEPFFLRLHYLHSDINSSFQLVPLPLTFLGNMGKRGAKDIEDISDPHTDSRKIPMLLHGSSPGSSRGVESGLHYSAHSSPVGQNSPGVCSENPLGETAQEKDQRSSQKAFPLNRDVLVAVLKRCDLRTIATCYEVSSLFRQGASEVLRTVREVRLVTLLGALGPELPTAEVAVSVLARLSRVYYVLFDASSPFPGSSIVMKCSHLFCQTYRQQNLRHVGFVGVPLQADLLIPFIAACGGLESMELARHDSINDKLLVAISRFCCKFNNNHLRPRFRLFRLLSTPKVTSKGFGYCAISFTAIDFRVHDNAAVGVAQIGSARCAPRDLPTPSFSTFLNFVEMHSLRFIVARPSHKNRNYGDIQSIDCTRCPTLFKICIQTHGYASGLKKIAVTNCSRFESFEVLKVTVCSAPPSLAITPSILFANLEILDLQRCTKLSAKVFDVVFGISSGVANVLPKLKHLKLSDTPVRTVKLQSLTQLESVHVCGCPLLERVFISGCEKVKIICVVGLTALQEARLCVDRYCQIDGTNDAWRSTISPCGRKVCVAYRS